MLAVLPIGLLIGTLIGTVGIGGILLAPLLTVLLGLDLHLAMATSAWSFLFTGFAGTLIYARRGSIAWRTVLGLGLGIIPATILGARTNAALPTQWLTIALAGLIVFSGLNSLRQRSEEQRDHPIGGLWLAVIGLGVGFGSALTGTGGPVLLVPILLLLNQSPLRSVGVSQAVQIPIAAFAALGFWLYGDIDFRLGTTLGLLQAVGVVLGAWIAHRVPGSRLRRLVALALVAVGALMIADAFS